MCSLAYSTDSQERGQNRLAAAHLPDSGCESASCSLLTSGPAASTPAIVCPCQAGIRYLRWMIGSAFEDGLSRLVQTGETDGLQAAVALTVQTYLGRNWEPGGLFLPFPAGPAILAVLGSIDPIFRHEVWLDSQPTLRLTLQRYAAADPLVQDLVREGQRIDMTDYITAALRYYEEHGSPCMDLQQQAALVRNSFPTAITSRNLSVPFILIGHDERERSKLGTHTALFQEELAGVEKFGPPYYRLRAALLAGEREANRHGEHVREMLEELPLFHAGVVVAVGKSSVAAERLL